MKLIQSLNLEDLDKGMIEWQRNQVKQRGKLQRNNCEPCCSPRVLSATNLLSVSDAAAEKTPSRPIPFETTNGEKDTFHSFFSPGKPREKQRFSVRTD